MWEIPLFDVDFGVDEKSAVAGVLESGWLTMGEATSEFEQKFAEFSGIRHAIAVCNGTAGLHLAHRVLGIAEGDEVICPSLTFVAGANAIMYCGGRCVFADITSQEDLTISPEDIEAKITENTRAIQVMHYGGYPCDMEAIVEIARRHQLYIIEDCAHAPGSELNGIKCGGWGDVGVFSLFSNKNFTTGEGGVVVTNNDQLADKLRLMRSHGMTTLTVDRHKGHAFSYDVIEEGYNYRFDEVRAALGLVQLSKLSSYNAKRKELTEAYHGYLEGIEQVKIPFVNHRGVSAYHIFPILVENSEVSTELMQFLKNNRIQSSIHYRPIHLFSRYQKDFNTDTSSLGVTEDAASREVTLPLYPSMGLNEVGFVCETVKKFFNLQG